MKYPVLSFLVAWICTSVAQNTAGNQSAFLSDNHDFEFGLNIPNNNSTDVYFALRGSRGNTWTAVGFGKRDMNGVLVLMMYQNAAGTGVTLSPRVSCSSVEPTFEPSIQIQSLPGTGVVNDTLVFNGRCTNCRSWNGGSLDVRSTSESFIYAVGPQGVLQTDDKAVSVQYHSSFGWFTMNMVSATGPAHVPSLNAAAGSQVGKEWKNQSDIVPPIHGIVSLVAFLALFPLCVIVYELADIPWLYMVLQVLAVLVALGGIGVGIYGATWYNRTKHMSAAHQIVGFIVLALLLLEVVMGCVRFPRYRRERRGTSPSTAVSKGIHLTVLSLGWLALLLGCINGFLGFPFAGRNEKNKIIGGVFAAVVVILCIAVILGHRRKQRRELQSRNSPKH